MASKDLADRCVSCPAVACEEEREGGATRRAFLQTAGCVGVAVALFGLGPRDAQALPLGVAAGAGGGGERRYPIPVADSVNVDRGPGLIIVRYQGHVYVFALACPHQNNAVKWVAKDHRFQCTKHDSQYQPDGIHTEGRATRNMDRYVTRRDGDAVVVDLHKWIESDKDPKGWEAATIAV
jgi:nitrite reductase/ring-hydroxylating ferredoxin subunit